MIYRRFGYLIGPNWLVAEAYRYDSIIRPNRHYYFRISNMDKTGSRFRDTIGGMPTLKIVDAKYVIKNHVLGKGSFSTTFLATREGLEDPIACKMIAKKDLVARINNSKNKLPTKDYLLNALKNEVNTWKTLKHPNIVSFYDFSETASNIYFFLELCEDGYPLDICRSLDKLVKEKGRLPEAEAIRLFLQMSAGCEYLYDKGIFHRDIKPENILIHKGKQQSKAGQVKIADFGFVKVLEKEGVATTSVGTPSYMAPQVLAGQPYGIKCDVWSLGVVFYQCLCGFMPW